MDTNFWLERWRLGETGFHQTRVTPLLQEHWGALALPPATRVLVPLAGKSLDVAWLALQGHEVLAVELSPIAVRQFFEGQGLTPTTWNDPLGTHYRHGNIEYLCGNVFDLDDETLAGIQGCYDRAALIALPGDLRARYVENLYGRLSAGCRTLLLTLDYPQEEMDGPPFAVSDEEVARRYGPHSTVERLETRDVLAKEPAFAARGLTRMKTSVFRLTAR